MANHGLKALEAQLRARPPKGLARLGDEQLRDLADAIEEIRHRQAAELAIASERALDHIPRLLRAPLRKVLG